MEKKIKNLTVKELMDYCNKQRDISCAECKLSDPAWNDCLVSERLADDYEYLKDVEVDL